MSYKSAWDALDAMNNLAGSPLVESSIGGRHGGGTRLTDWGRRLVALFRVLERHYQGTLDLLAEGLEAAETSDPAELRALLRRMTLRTSARNRLVGTLVELRIDEPRALATLALAAGPRVAVALTADSARELGLAVGGEVYALIKASSVVLGTDPSPRISAANRLWGEVSRIHEGTGDAEVTLILAGGWT
jgi:molybdate transport system regulatory protein